MHAKTVLALAGLAAALPTSAAVAQAPTPVLTINATCAASGSQLALGGSGFTPGGIVDISGEFSGSFTADALGAFQGTVTAPQIATITPKVVKVLATDQTNPAATASASFSVVKEYFLSNSPLNGKPSGKTTWKFAGFIPNKPIYGHYRFHKKTIKNYRFGLAKGVCGTLTVRARRLPAKSRPGTWTLQLDQKKTYGAFTKPRRQLSFTIFRRFF